MGNSYRPTRRCVLQAGCSSVLGLGLPALLAARSRAPAKEPQVKSVVLVFLSGGASHIDTFDPKPEATETRGEFQTIKTRIPGVAFTEHLPLLADRANKLAIVRSMAHRDNRHLSGTHNTLTGAIQPFRGDSNEDKQLNRGDWPCYGAAIAHLRPQGNSGPSQVTAANPLIEGSLVWPGQHAGILGAKYDPLVLKDDPNQADFKVSGLALSSGLSVSRLDHRRELLRELNRQKSSLDAMAHRRQFTDQQNAAYSMLTSPSLTNAFNIQGESSENRDRYGRNTLGQTLLLARRLVEIETPVIQCNMGRVQTWDTHTGNFPKLKNQLLPQVDQGVSALLDDLQDRGLLDQTLVIMVGEFGRTPNISTLPNTASVGRGHWAWCYTAVFAGGGVAGGQVIGKSDHIGAYPLSTPYHPNDLGATIYHALGVDPASMLHDRFNRPIHLNQGSVMDVLYSGAEA